MHCKQISIAIALLVISAVVVLPVLAGSASYSGSNVGAPTFNRMLANCMTLSSDGTATHYHTQTLYVDQAGSYNFFSDQAGWDGYLHLYAAPFDPSNPATNCLIGDDDVTIFVDSEFDYMLDANTTYVLVTSGFGNTDTGSFTNTITGPGSVYLDKYVAPAAVANGPGPDMVYIPLEAVVGTFLVDTPAQWDPWPGTESSTVMAAGKTAWVYGLDESGAYYKVMLSGKYFWVPVESMGPNYDEVWHGTPLPVTVAE